MALGLAPLLGRLLAQHCGDVSEASGEDHCEQRLAAELRREVAGCVERGSRASRA